MVDMEDCPSMSRVSQYLQMVCFMLGLILICIFRETALMSVTIRLDMPCS